ncbi:hypothetical protein [Nocardia asiatica]|uniref:hypothetical protein n=1 Tax=Nocardia asiatica TaxID=209252 RepID=UPI0024550934|nr:hypothetical protein [Nocardia asiatica]
MPELCEGDEIVAAVGETDWVLEDLANHYVAEPESADACPLSPDELWDGDMIVSAFREAIEQACNAASLHWDTERGVISYPESLTAAQAAELWNGAVAAARHGRLGEIVAETRAGRGARLTERTGGREWVLPN